MFTFKFGKWKRMKKQSAKRTNATSPLGRSKARRSYCSWRGHGGKWSGYYFSDYQCQNWSVSNWNKSHNRVIAFVPVTMANTDAVDLGSWGKFFFVAFLSLTDDFIATAITIGNYSQLIVICIKSETNFIVSLL